MNEKSKSTNSINRKRQSRDSLTITIIALLLLLAVGIVVVSTLGYIYGWEWVGVIDTQTGKIKTLWDWMELWLIPFVIAIGAYLLNKSDKAHEHKIAEQRRENERRIADQRAAVE